MCQICLGIISEFFGFSEVSVAKIEALPKFNNDKAFRVFNRDPGRTQTCNPQSRNLIFYSVELRGQLLYKSIKLLLNGILCPALFSAENLWFSCILEKKWNWKFLFFRDWTTGPKLDCKVIIYSACIKILLGFSFLIF